MNGRLGVIVNPVAGVGGTVGLKGSDGHAVQAEARRRGGTPAAPRRAIEALRMLAGESLGILTVGAAMGEAVLASLGLPCAVVMRPASVTTPQDTSLAAARLAEAGVDLILFSGGDGTARDVLEGATATPILGIPGGVKMYSGVFAASPALAGRLAADFLRTPPAARRIADAEVLDIDETDLRRDAPAARLFGLARVPVSASVARAKASTPVNDDAELEALSRALAVEGEPGGLTIVGPGRTMRQFMAVQGLPKTLLGVDLVRDGKLIATDCAEADILAALQGGPARIVVGLLGQQGCLFGRGNQQISAEVLRRVGAGRIHVLATAAKVATLEHGLFVDTGDAAVNQLLAGFMRVETGPRRASVLRVRC